MLFLLCFFVYFNWFNNSAQILLITTNFFFPAVLLLVSCFFFQIAKKYIKVKNFQQFEFDAILIFSVLGLVLICFSNNFVNFYLGLELQSLCFYVAAVFLRSSEFGSEASLKYFVLGAFASTILLFGMSFVFVLFGCLEFESILRLKQLSESLFLLFCFFLIATGILFKIGAFPVHV